jgi:hypothetical protein
MSTSLNPTKLDLSDYTRPLPPLFGAVLLVSTGTGSIFWLRGLGFWNGFVGFSVSAVLVMLLIGGFAFAGSYLDRRLGHDVTFRLVGAAIGFVVLVFTLYHLAPVFLSPEAVTGAGLR